MRKLARIVTVGPEDIEPIQGADRIVAAHVGGWTVVIPKTDAPTATGSKYVYFEIDSCLPKGREEFAPMMARSCQRLRLVDEETGTAFDFEGHRLRTARLRGVYSQGLLMPAAQLFSEAEAASLEEGEDVSARLGVVKYAPALAADAGGSRPVGSWDERFAPKTDAERLQNLADHWDEIRSMEWMPTLKVDGTSTTVVNDDGKIRVFSRNLEVAEEDMRWVAAVEQGLVRIVEQYPGLAVQSELVGEGIQKNRLRLRGRKILVFSVWRNGEKLERSEWPSGLEEMGVPVLGPEWLPAGFTDVDSLVRFVADECRGFITGGLNEGVVYHWRPSGDEEHQEPPRWLSRRSCFKVVSNRYLMKNE